MASDIGLATPGDMNAQFFGAEDVVKGNEQPLRILRLPACRDVFEIGRLYLRVRLDKAYAGIAAAQLPSDLFLEFVEGLHRIPARRPESGDKR